MFSGINGIQDTFTLVSGDSGLIVTRMTSVEITGKMLLLKKAALLMGLKQVHRYVFRNWQHLIEMKEEIPEEIAVAGNS